VWLPLRAVGASVHYTELAGVNHNAWDPVYDDAELVEWLLTQLRH
jgi:predicted peptidase